MSLRNFSLTPESLLNALVEKYSNGEDMSQDIQEAIKMLSKNNSISSDPLRPSSENKSRGEQVKPRASEIKELNRKLKEKAINGETLAIIGLLILNK